MSRRDLPNLGSPEDGYDETHVASTSSIESDSGEFAQRFAAQPFLVVVAGASHVVFPLTEADTIIGREGGGAQFQISEPSLSRKHARITFDGVDYHVEDLGSRNGTFLNGKPIHGAYRLAKGDRLRLGPTLVLRMEWPSADGFDEEEEPTSSLNRNLLPWEPGTWRTRDGLHLPKYEDPKELSNVVSSLSKLPPLVTSWEIEKLKGLIAEAQSGHRFLLQGGDCAETFADCDSETITNKLKILLQMSLVLTHAARKPVIRVGRLAGQYAKPRSSPTEIRNGITLPNYVGDLVNRAAFTPQARRPDPELLLAGYYRAALTLNYVRSLCVAGFSSRSERYFDIPKFERPDMPEAVLAEYTRIRRQVTEGLHFLRAMGDPRADELRHLDFFVSHEGLNLEYESAQTRRVPNRDGWYCLTTHLPWIGERTRAIRGAHVEFFRGISNPVAVKVGPSTTTRDVIDLLRVLNPADEPGKIVLIVRMGAGKVPTKLPPLIEAVARARRKVLWVTDPMHGNTVTTKSGLKTRHFSAVLEEVEETFDTHEKCGSVLGGVHFELTGDDVTECLGAGLTEADLDTRYMTTCDPRLNRSQALEMTFAIARRISGSSVRRASSLPPRPLT